MKITILGCGAANGVPMVSFGWGRCDPENPKNRRLRPSILVESQDSRILIDTSPDLRQQLLNAGVNDVRYVLYTHAHADHVHGIDDLREVNRATRRPIDVYGSDLTLNEIESRFAYVFTPLDPETTPIYKPWLIKHAVSDRFRAGSTEIIPFDQDHGYTMTTGFRFARAAYSTDVRALPEASFDHLHDLDLWIVGCLMDKPHPTHAHVDLVLEWVERLKPKRTILTHMSPRLDYEQLKASLPAGVEPAYDGMMLDIADDWP